jgi:hypothetical protein
LTANTLTIVCTTSVNAVAVGVNKITFAAGELTTGPGAAASATGFTVTTSEDLVSAGANAPALVGTVQSPAFALATADQKALQATTAVTTVTFTTQTQIPAAGTITITLPANYFSGKATPAAIHVPASGTAATLFCPLTANTLTIVCTTIQTVAVGVNKITFAAGELITGPAVAASASGLTVSTSVDAVSAGTVVPALAPATTTAGVDVGVAVGASVGGVMCVVLLVAAVWRLRKYLSQVHVAPLFFLQRLIFARPRLAQHCQRSLVILQLS